MKGALTIATGLAALLAAAPAPAQEAGPVVASHGAATLRMSDSDPEIDRPCVHLELGGERADDCDRRVTAGAPIVATMPGAAGGAVAPAVARVEVEWRDGERSAVDSVPNQTYAGRLADRIRFFVISRPGSSPLLIRYVDAEGRLLAATQDGGGPVVGRRTIARGRLRSSPPWRAHVFLTRQLAPAPGRPDRTEIEPCLQIKRGAFTIDHCAHPEPGLRERLTGGAILMRPGDEPRGTPQRHVLFGLLGPGATGATLVLGDGRRLRGRVHAVRGGGATERAVWRTVPRGAAIRRLIVHGAGGRRIEEQALALAPATLGNHPQEAGATSETPPLPAEAATAAGPAEGGEGVLRVREVGARLCVEVDGATAAPECGLLSHVFEDSLVTGGRTASGRAVVGGVVATDVAAVELIAGDGANRATRRVPTQPASPYAGPFAPHVRAFVAVLGAAGTVEARLLDADGQELTARGVDTAPAIVSGPVSRPLTRLRSGRLRVLQDRNFDDCLFVNDRAAQLVLQTCHFGGRNRRVDVLVACRPAASVVVVPHAGASLVTARGRRLRGHPVRLGGRRHTVFVVHAPDAPRRVRWRDGRAALGAIPSPRAQCGYESRRDVG